MSRWELYIYIYTGLPSIVLGLLIQFFYLFQSQSVSLRAISSAGVKKTSAGVSTTEVYADAGGQTDILSICDDLMRGQKIYFSLVKKSLVILNDSEHMLNICLTYS